MMTQREVEQLMLSSMNESEWNANCDKVKAAFGGDYPQFWYSAIVLSGLMDKAMGQGVSDITVTANSNFVALAGGWSHSLGLKSGGSIAAWGSNEYGQCNVPEPNTDFVALAGGMDHSLGLKSDGSIVAWGDNSAGQCDVPKE